MEFMKPQSTFIIYVCIFQFSATHVQLETRRVNQAVIKWVLLDWSIDILID